MTHKTVVLNQKIRYFTSEKSISQSVKTQPNVCSYYPVEFLLILLAVLWIVAKAKESSQGRMVDALAHGGDEGRDKLR